MRNFLLDTQTIRYWYNAQYNQHAAVVGNIARLRQAAVSFPNQPKLLVSVVSLGEIEYGHRVVNAHDADANREYLVFVRRELPEPFELFRDVREAYGELRARLFDKYAPGEKRKKGMRPEQLLDPITAKELGIQENDLWLCAQAITHAMVLVTNDRMVRLREISQDINTPFFTQNWTVPNSAHVPQ